LKWISQDVEQYVKAKEYIDTAVIPLIPVAFGSEMKQSASMSEFITIVSTFLERQCTGRILLLPSFTYFSSSNFEKIGNELEEWVIALKNNHFKHVYLITCDKEWIVHESRLKESLIWLPIIPIENFENSQKMSIIESQVQQILAIISKKWQEDA
jgi:hypothetical protein